MATLRNPLPDLGQPRSYSVKMKRDDRGLTIISARLTADLSQRYESVPLKPDQLRAALSACVMLEDGRADQAERDFAAKGRVDWRDVELLPSDMVLLKLEPVLPFLHSLSNAPVEEEDLTDEMSVVLDQARASLARGESISHDEILREFEGD